MNKFILKTWIGLGIFVVLMLAIIGFIFFYPVEYLETETRFQAKGFVYEASKEQVPDEILKKRKPLQGVESMILFENPKNLKKSDIDEMFLLLHAKYKSIPEIETAFSRGDGSYSVIGIEKHSINITFWKKISDESKEKTRINKIWVIYRKDGYRNLILEQDVRSWPNRSSSKSRFENIKDVFLIPLK